MTARQNFSERVKTRLRLWWGQPPQRAWRLERYRAHALRERYARRRRDEPDDVWRCCAFWQRTLINKWNSREFAARHGCPVPALYWCARLPSAARVRALPPAFVIRPLWGTSRHGVYVVVGARPPAWRAVLGHGAASEHPARRETRLELADLAEEFVRSEDASTGCRSSTSATPSATRSRRCRCWSGRAPTGRGTASHAHWRAFADPMNASCRRRAARSARLSGEMLALAARLGAPVGTYMRVDFFATDRGCVFNEFASTPANGDGFTPFCDDLFGALWDAKFPRAT
jgi:hypothetical protein